MSILRETVENKKDKGKTEISQPSPNLLSTTNSHVSGATTAVTLASADQAELSNLDQDLAPSPLIASLIDSPALNSVSSSDNDAPSESIDRGQLADFLGSLILGPQSLPHQRENEGIHNILSADDTAFDEDFLKRKVLIEKSGENFQEKLKQFFVLSSAGKLIYSLNGDEAVLLGYMGLITTIISSFQEGLGKQFEKIQSKNFKMVVMVKSPIILVAITKIPHEMLLSSAATDSLLENQLSLLHNYIQAVISESVITKNFNRGMNFDLRKLLSAQDYSILDKLAMLLTYGFYSEEGGHLTVQSAFYLKSLLGNATQCAKITNTSRQKLNEIFASVKKIKTSRDDSDLVSMFQGKFGSNEEAKYLASDLLFGFITLEEKVVTYLRPKNHQLCHQDISTVLSATSFYCQTLSHEESMDLWIPLCMPNFNSSGFLYSYLRLFKVNGLSKPLTLILLSGSKNSFYDMKEIAEYLISKISCSKVLEPRLGKELSHNIRPNWVLNHLKIPNIKHFIYKREDNNQFYMDDYPQSAEPASLEAIRSSLELIYLYTNLINSMGHREVCTEDGRKLTYTRWQKEDDLITGFLLTDEKYSYCCVCTGSVSSKIIIEQSLRIIRWCDKFGKRLFARNGTVF